MELLFVRCRVPVVTQLLDPKPRERVSTARQCPCLESLVIEGGEQGAHIGLVARGVQTVENSADPHKVMVVPNDVSAVTPNTLLLISPRTYLLTHARMKT